MVITSTVLTRIRTTTTIVDADTAACLHAETPVSDMVDMVTTTAQANRMITEAVTITVTIMATITIPIAMVAATIAEVALSVTATTMAAHKEAEVSATVL